MAEDTTEKKPSRALKKLWSDRRYNNYFSALGEFVHSFSAAESAIAGCLHHYSNVSTDVHRAVFSGVRIKVGTGFIRRLAEVEVISAADWKGLKAALDHLGVINDKRNKILHLGADGIDEDEEPYVSNLATALTWKALEEFPVTVGHLRQMTHDVETIFFKITLRYAGAGWGYTKRTRPRLEKRADEPWQYKPPQPTRIHRPHKDEFAKLRRPPKA